MIAEIAFTLHTPLDVLMDMDWDEVQEWHRQCERLARKMDGKTDGTP